MTSNKGLESLRGGRLLYVDIIKNIAMLYIVGYWHLRLSIGPSHIEPIFWWSGFMTNVFLGAFMFFSGFCLSKYSFVSFKRDTLFFYKKRFVRFYPLYILSLISLFLLPYIRELQLGWKVIVTSLLGVSTYILPQPPTLWFFSMLVGFYLMTPLILYYKSSFQRLIVIITIFILFFLVDKMFSSGIDHRFFWYFPMYCIGLLFGSYSIIDKYSKYLFYISLPVLLISIYCLRTYNIKYSDVTLLQFAFIFSCLMVIIWLVKITSNLAFWKPFLAISSCTMCAYLFHRQIYTVLDFIYGKLGLDFGYWFTAIIYLPVCLLISFVIQKIYDVNIVPRISCIFHLSQNG